MHGVREQTGCILFFVKYPEQGSVKTRLARALPDGVAVQLYRRFVTDVLSMLHDIERPVVICYTPPGRAQAFRDWLGDGYRYLPQRGNNLGERLRHGFVDAFSVGCNSAVAIGSDSPDLPPAFIREAFDAIGKNQVVIGPAVDGGYYLIGFPRNTFMPAAFEGIEWSTPTVYAETMRKIRAEHARGGIHVLPPWKDVDTLEDLHELYHRNRKSPYATSDTMRYIARRIL